MKALIQVIHETGSGFITHFPKRANHIVRARAQKRPCEANQSFTGKRALSAAIAGRNRDELRMDRMLNDFAGVEFEGVFCRR